MKRVSLPLFRRVDHVIVRTEPGAHAPLLSLLRDGFGLPAPWPLSRHAAFASGGVSLGNVPLELLALGPTRRGAPAAAGFGVAFEARGQLADLHAAHHDRGVTATVPVPYYVRDEAGALRRLWSSVYFTGLAGASLALRLFALLAPFAARRSRPSNVQGRTAWAFANRVFARGMYFAVAYDKSFTSPMRSLEAAPDRPPLGALGLLRTRAIVIGATDPDAALARWARLLGGPAAPELALPEGPAVRVEAAGRNGLAKLVLEVQSVSVARALADRLGLQVVNTPHALRISGGALDKCVFELEQAL
jgi:hypothetical protein